MQQLLVSKEEILSKQQEDSQSLEQKDRTIKQEQEDLWVNQEGKEADITEFPFTVVSVKIEDEENPQSSSQRHSSQSDGSTEIELLPSNSTEYRRLKRETEREEECGSESQPARGSAPCSHVSSQNDDMQPFLLITKVPSEQQDWNTSVDQQDVKKKQEELWISQQGEQQRHLEEADITAVLVKSENDENVDEPEGSSSTEGGRLRAEGDGPQTGSNSRPSLHLQPDTSGSETEADSCRWKQTREMNSDFNSQTNWCNASKKKNNFVPCGPMKYPKHPTGMQASEKPFGCPECGKRFVHKSKLIRHIRGHAGEKFDCSQCGKIFIHKSKLIRHTRGHTGEKPFDCSECDRRFVQKSSLITHMKMHTGEKPFDCSDCGKRFVQKSKLATHRRIHTGDKPYDCSECGIKFGLKSHLITHMRIHTGEKPFDCSECGKRFGQMSHLITHTRIHTGEKPFGCCECGKRFVQKSHMMTHMTKHTEEKPFECSNCEKHFRDETSLITHMRVHTGKKPLGCSECSKRFWRKSHLIRHMRIHISN